MYPTDLCLPVSPPSIIWLSVYVPLPACLHRQAFIKESSHLSDSSSETLHLMLSSQMFERFIEERIANPNHPQVS